MEPESKRRKILPELGKRNVLITSALPYVNNVPHLGNVVGSVLSADVFSRYCKSRGYNCLYVCGTDEYGTATETKALEEKVTPQQLCDKYYALHSEVYEWFEIGFDIFGRTPTQQQTDIAQDIFLKLYKNGYLEERTTIQPYCEKHDAYLADRYVEGECPLCGYKDARGDQCDKCGNLLDPLDLINPRCKLDNATPVPRETKHVFMLLDKLQPQIDEWFREASAKGAWSYNGTIITETWLKNGLTARGITRDLKWGTAVPLEGYEKKVLYVWFDACIGYVSITANYTEEWEKWWRDPQNVQLYQFMGKDNVPFHAVIFPGSELGTKDTWTMPHHISTTEYLNYENGKFSKSRGIGVFGNNAKDTGIPADVWRYYLLSHRPESSDSEFEWKGFIDANNNHLLKNLGNFVNRIVKFVNAKNYESVVPDYTQPTDVDAQLDRWQEEVNALLKTYVEELEAVKIRGALATAMRISSHGNLLLQENTLDNRLFAEQPARCAAVVGRALNLVHLLSAIIGPYMPATSRGILQQLNVSPLQIPESFTAGDFAIKPGHKIGTAAYLFSQIKPDKEVQWREQFGGDEARKAKEEKARNAAAKKAEKIRRKEAKKDGTSAAASGAETAVNGTQKVEESVEAIEKGGAQRLDTSKDAVDAVVDGINQASLQPS